MPTRHEIEQLRRQTGALLEQIDDGDLRQRLAEARERQERLVAAAETTASNTSPRVVRGSMTIRDKTRYVAKHGMDRYLRLPWS